MITFYNMERDVNSIEIEEIEQMLGLKLPNQYREHLLKYNGGQCEPNIFIFNENGKLSDSCIDWFLAIYEGEYDNLNRYIIEYKIENKRLPEMVLPIAHDPGGNLICISCSGEDYGKVYFWDHEREMDASIGFSNLFFVANSFNEFIDNLKE